MLGQEVQKALSANLEPPGSQYLASPEGDSIEEREDTWRGNMAGNDGIQEQKKIVGKSVHIVTVMMNTASQDGSGEVDCRVWEVGLYRANTVYVRCHRDWLCYIRSPDSHRHDIDGPSSCSFWAFRVGFGDGWR